MNFKYVVFFSVNGNVNWSIFGYTALWSYKKDFHLVMEQNIFFEKKGVFRKQLQS